MTKKESQARYRAKAWRDARKAHMKYFVIVLALALSGCTPKEKPTTEVFYIISVAQYTNMDESLTYVVDYAKNGETFQAVFRSAAKVDEYISHLSLRGVVIRGDL